MLVVVGGNLAKALAAAQHYHPSVVVEQSTTDALRVLRNLYEHWDEQRVAFESPNTDKTRSAAEFAAKFPERRPWSIVYDTTDSYLAGVVGIAQFTSALVAIEDELLRAGAGTRKVTGCLTSA